MSKGIAIFDFDGTLIAGDSLLPFLERVVGKRKARFAMVRSLRSAVLRASRGKGGDIRTQVKAGLLARTLKGIPAEKAQQAADDLAGWLRWHPPTLDALRRHADKGHRVIVATGALALYMPRLLAHLPVDGLMATEMESVDGVLTGHMQGGNCVRDEKARRVAALLQREGPFTATYGYGNRPSDLPFLALMQHPTIVPTVGRRGKPKPGTDDAE